MGAVGTLASLLRRARLPNWMPPQQLFFQATSFDQDIGDWETGSGTNFLFTFAAALVFNQDIGAWDTSKAETFFYMFLNAREFDNKGQPMNWETSSVTNMRVRAVVLRRRVPMCPVCAARLMIVVLVLRPPMRLPTSYSHHGRAAPAPAYCRVACCIVG